MACILRIAASISLSSSVIGWYFSRSPLKYSSGTKVSAFFSLYDQFCVTGRYRRSVCSRVLAMYGFSTAIVPPTQPAEQAFSSMNSSEGILPFSIWSSTRMTFSMPSAARYRSLNSALASPPADAHEMPIIPLCEMGIGVLSFFISGSSAKYTSFIETTRSTLLFFPMKLFLT